MPAWSLSNHALFDVLKDEAQAHHIFDDNPLYTLSSRLPDPLVVEEYGRGVGLEAEKIEALKQKRVRVVEATRTGVHALIGQSHMQFIMSRSVAHRIRPLPSSHALFREETKKINAFIDELGLVQLTSLEAYVYHMGNRLDEATLDEIHRMNLDSVLQQSPLKHNTPLELQALSSKKRALQMLGRLESIPFLKKTLQRFYNFLFEYYAQEK